MNPHLNANLAAANTAELERRARRRHYEEAITIRTAAPSDGLGLMRLAALDSASVPRLPALVAEAGGRLLAARSLRDGTEIADPFVPTAHVRKLLAVRAAADAPRRRRGFWLRLRPAARG